MTIEVTETDVAEFVKLSGWDDGDWDPSFTTTVIAAAWEVMKRKHADTLADAVKESLESNCSVQINRGTCKAIVKVSTVEKRSQRFISIDDNFSALATAAVRQLSQQVRQ